MKPTEPAFPLIAIDEQIVRATHTGMTIRQYYAGQAIIGVLLAYSKLKPNDPYPQCNTTTELARQAWDIADALLDTENPKP